MIKDLEVVALTRPVPEYGLAVGDVGTVVMVYDGGKGFTVEFMTVKGKTIAIVTLDADAIRPVEEREIANARAVA
jgi:Domain of unknown function (DUF4926)